MVVYKYSWILAHEKLERKNREEQWGGRVPQFNRNYFNITPSPSCESILILYFINIMYKKHDDTSFGS
jgi:hypothetical protein